MQAFLFDMDGVLLDSEPAFLSHIQDFVREKGNHLGHDELDQFVGISGQDTVALLLRRFHWPLTQEACYQEYIAHQGILHLSSHKVKAAEGVRELLALLHGKGLKLGLVSSSRCSYVLAALTRFSFMPFFDAALGVELVERPKPAPDGYLLAAQFLGVKPEDCVVVEDSPTGIQAGKAAGMYVVGYRGSSYPQDVSAADELVVSFGALKARLPALLN